MDVIPLPIGAKAPNFVLSATDGSTYKLSDFHATVLVVFFTCNHCPYAQAYEDRVKRLASMFEGKVEFVAINSNDAEAYPEDSFAEMIARSKQRKFNFVYLHDETQEIAKAYGAECTPHFFVFDTDHTLQYQGRLDDSWKNEDHVRTHELQDAIVALLADKEVLVKKTNPLGCSIKWKKVVA